MRRISIILSLACVLAACSEKSGNDVEKGMTANIATDSVSDKIAEVTVMPLVKRVFNHEIVSNGKLNAREKVDVNFQSPGLIASIYVKNGQRVAKGQKIATLDAYKLENQLAKEMNAVASARLEMQDVIIGQGYDPDHLEKVPDEVLKLARLRSGLEQAELSLASVKRDINEATLVAPISGIVANLSAKANNMSSSSEPLCRIINDGAMDVEFSVLESELAMVKQGDKVAVAPFSGGESHQGRVSEIKTKVVDNGMVKVWATVDGGKGLIDGMNVRVSVKRAVEDTLVVPKSAVVLRSGRQVVFTVSGNKAMWNYVTTGFENLNEYTVTDGLSQGMTVIISGNVNLAHEAPIRVVEK